MSERRFKNSKIEELIRSILEDLLGSNSLQAFEYHLEKAIDGEDLYTTFWKHPGKFYAALENLFGPGAETFLRLIAHKLAAERYLAVKPEEFVSVFKLGRGKIEELFKL